MKKQAMTLDSLTALDGSEDWGIGTPIKLGKFEDIFGTQHDVHVPIKGRSTAMCSWEVEILKVQVMEKRQLVRLANPTTKGVQEVWVGMERFS